MFHAISKFPAFLHFDLDFRYSSKGIESRQPSTKSGWSEDNSFSITRLFLLQLDLNHPKTTLSWKSSHFQEQLISVLNQDGHKMTSQETGSEQMVENNPVTIGNYLFDNTGV